MLGAATTRLLSSRKCLVFAVTILPLLSNSSESSLPKRLELSFEGVRAFPLQGHRGKESVIDMARIQH